MIAKSFQKYAITSEPYLKNGRLYVTISTGREVRWYSEAEYNKMYPSSSPTPTPSLVLGFHNGYVRRPVSSDLSPEILSSYGFRYAVPIGWYYPSNLPEPAIPTTLFYWTEAEPLIKAYKEKL